MLIVNTFFLILKILQFCKMHIEWWTALYSLIQHTKKYYTFLEIHLSNNGKNVVYFFFNYMLYMIL